MKYTHGGTVGVYLTSVLDRLGKM